MRAKRSKDEVIWSKQFGDKLRRLIHIGDMTQSQFAKEMGVSEETISRYVNGACYPTPYAIQKMVNILECSVDQLFDVYN